MDGAKVAVGALIVVAGLLFYRMQHPLTGVAADITSSDWDEVLQQNNNNGKPQLVLFATTSCGYCRRLESNVLSRQDIRDELKNHYVFYTVDLSSMSEEVSDRAHALGIDGVPFLIRYDAFGRETGRAHYMSADGLLEWLKAGE